MSKMAEKFGRIRPEGMRKAHAAGPRLEKNMRPAVRKVEVCRMVYFDDKGKFTSNPRMAKKVALHPSTGKARPGGPSARTFKGTNVIDLDGEGKALAYVSFRGQVALVRIKDPALEQAKKDAKGDKALLREIAVYESNLKRQAAAEALKKRHELSEAAQTRREALLLEASQRSDNAKKAAKTQAAKKQAVTEQQKKEAADWANALELRVQEVERRMAGAKGQKKERLMNQKKRLRLAIGQLEKIAAGKAYKFPTPGQLR